MSSSLLSQHILFIWLGWFMGWEVSGCTVAVLEGSASRIGSIQQVAFLCSSHLAFSPCISLSVQVVHPYSSTDTATVWKKSHYILSSEWSDFYILDNLSVEVHAFPMRMLISFSVDEILQLRYVNWFTNFRGLPLEVEKAPPYLKHNGLCFICVHTKAIASRSFRLFCRNAKS